MKEKEFIAKLKSKEDKLLLSYIIDKYYQYNKRGISTSSNFLNDRELNFLENSLTYLKLPYNVYKPNKFCERSIIYFGEYENFVTFYKIEISAIKHSDILGSLFGSGLSHSVIGDLFVLENVSYITNLEKYDPLLETALTKIGKKSIKLEKIENLPLIEKKFMDISFSAGSTRLDLILSKLLKISRKDSLEFLKKKRILLNYREIDKICNLVEGDILSIEGYGKIIVHEIQENNKDKVKINIKKYC